MTLYWQKLNWVATHNEVDGTKPSLCHVFGRLKKVPAMNSLLPNDTQMWRIKYNINNDIWLIIDPSFGEKFILRS